MFLHSMSAFSDSLHKVIKHHSAEVPSGQALVVLHMYRTVLEFVGMAQVTTSY